MVKIGRNDPCPCGSGAKYKRCCITKTDPATIAAKQVSVGGEVAKLQEMAILKEESIRSIGVFIFISTADGDGWLLELTDQDALLVAKDGKKIEVEIEENADTIEVNWSHRFVIREKKFQTTSYADNTLVIHEKFPVASVHSAIKRVNKSFSSQLLDSIHVS